MTFFELTQKFARETLDAFREISKVAQSALHQPALRGEYTFANHNPLTAPKQSQKLKQVDEHNRSSYRWLCKEPAVARVVYEEDGGKRVTVYITQSMPPSGLTVLAGGYRAPVGSLAERDKNGAILGERDWDGKTVEILEFAEYRPVISDGVWDSAGVIFEALVDGNARQWPFETLLGRAEQELPVREEDAFDDMLLDKQLSEATKIAREIVEKISLRDRPLLDRYQGAIFRMPLASRLLILGEAGTGKTTTLIKRLGQKLDARSLDEDDQRMVDIGARGEIPHAQNWVMFTPTHLLRFYVKEAFNRENVPAPDERICTWDDYSHDRARDTFGILQTSTSQGYVKRSDAQTLLAETEHNLIEWFRDFDQWQKADFLAGMRTAAQSLRKNSTPEVAQIGESVCEVLGESDETTVAQDVVASLVTMFSGARDQAKSMKASTDKTINGALNRQVNRNHGFLKELAEFIDGLVELGGESDEHDGEEEYAEDAKRPPSKLHEAVAAYKRAVSARARALARGGSISPTSRNGRIIEWMGDSSLSEQDLREVGASLIVQSALRRFVNPARIYINRLPSRYRRFRQVCRKENRWYTADGYRRGDVHPHEVDAMLLAMMQSSNALVGIERRIGDGNPARLFVERMQNLHRTQVLVDEATDFSPLQLAAMMALAHPRVRSFFACGDFMQRLTSWGIRSAEQMRWAVPDIDVQQITVPYRQSEQLRVLAGQISNLSGNGVEKFELPGGGVSPILACGMSGDEQIAEWLGVRIPQIEKSVGRLPSIAVLVHGEDEVDAKSKVESIAKSLGDKLEDSNIDVLACADGRALGQERTVRVFNVKDIKGLEFEAAFFIGIDQLAKNLPDLFDKYLYVGATRAATYFGVTCEGAELPPQMAGLRNLFKDNWLDPA